MWIRFLSLAVCVLLLPEFAEGGDNVAPAPPRTDLLGDPLPAGVVARLGTSRLFQPSAFTFAFSPDGKTLAALEEGKLRLWEVSSGKPLWAFAAAAPVGGYGIGGPVMAFSPDGKLVAFGGGGSAVHVCDVNAGQERFTVTAQPLSLEQVAFGPTGRTLVVGWNGMIEVWDLQKGAAVASWKTNRPLFGAVGAADGTVFAVASGPDADHPFVLYHGKPGDDKELSANVIAPDFSDEKTRSWTYAGVLSRANGLYAYARDGKRLWFVDAATGKTVRRIEGMDEQPRVLCFSGDCKVFGAAFPDGTARTWDVASGKLLHEFKALSTRIDHFALSQDGALLAVMGRQDGAIHIWDAARAAELHSFPGHRGGRLTVAFSGDGKTVFTTNRDNANWPVVEWADWSLRRWDAGTGKELSVVQKDLGQVRYTAFSPDGRLLALAVHDGLVHILDADSGKELHQGKAPTKEYTLNPGPHAQKWHYLAQFGPPAFSLDGQKLFTVGAGELDAWDTGTGRASASQKIPSVPEFAGCFPGPDGQSVVVTEWDNWKCRVVIRDANSGAERQQLVQVRADGPFPAAAMAPDGRTFAVCDGSAVSLWEIAGGRSRGRLADAPRQVSAVAFSPNGRLLAAGGDGEVKLWRLPSGRPVGQVRGYDGLVDSLAFSPNGKLLAVGGWGNVALICDVDSLIAGNSPEATKLTTRDLDDPGNDLAGPDGEKAFRAVARLADAADLSIPFLKARLQSAPKPDPGRIARLIADLDDDDFDVREKASAALARLGAAARGALRKVVEGRPSAELRDRAQRLLHLLDDPGGDAPPSEEVVRLRIIEALERSGAPAAQEVLKELANGAPDDSIAQQAQAAVERMTKRSGGPP